MANEGQTATNPQTGERVVFQGGQWQPMGGGAAPRVEAPGIIHGRPKQPTPYQQSAEQRAIDDQARQNAAFQTSQQKAQIDIQKGQKDLQPGADNTEAERTAGFLATRVAGGIDDLLTIRKRSKAAMSPNVSTEITRGIFGDTAANYANDSDRQQVEAAQGDILDAALTLGTGAAYTPEQIAAYRRSYFPQLGDSDDTISSKQTRLIRLLEAAKIKAGRAAPEIDRALAAIEGVDEIIEVDVSKDGIAANPNLYVGTDGLVYDKTTGQPVDPSPQGGGSDLGQAFYAGVGDVAEGVGDLFGLVANPINAGINAVAGTNLGTDLGQTFRDATGAPDGNPVASAINKGGTAAMTGVGIANAARPFASGAGEYVTNALMSQPVQQVVGGTTAGASAETAKQAGAPGWGQLLAGLGGGMAGFSGMNALMQLGSPKTIAPVAQAAQRQGIDMLPADMGGAATRRLTSAAAQAPLSAPPILNAAQKSNTQFGNAARSATGGAKLADDEAGAVIKGAGERFTKGSQEKGNSLYTRAEKMAQGVSVKAKGAIATIDEQIAELKQAEGTNKPLIDVLETFKADLAKNNGVKISGMRDLRTAAQKGAYDEKLRTTPAKRVLGIVANAVSNDIDAGLQQAGRGNAAQAFKTADAYWRDRVEYIDKVLEPIIGKGKSGESVLQSVEQMASGKGKGVQTLMKLMRSVEKDELADIQATVIDRMGKSSAANQNADGTAYSAGTFLTNWNKMSDKGKTALFPEPEVRKNLDELASIADNMKQSSRFANTSNSAGGIAGQIMLSGGLGSISPLTFVAGSGAQYVTGRLLASPKFTAWLSKIPANPQAQQAYVKRLDTIAASEPIIANDIASIQKFLSNAPGSSRAAATEGDDVGKERPIPPQ